jgi:hypothetical protein
VKKLIAMAIVAGLFAATGLGCGDTKPGTKVESNTKTDTAGGTHGAGTTKAGS